LVIKIIFLLKSKNMIWGIISLILLLVIIGLVIWLLVRGNNCVKKSSLNQTCNTTSDCNSGLVCAAGGGSAVTGVAGITGITGPFGNICKVAYGGVCSANSECAAGQVCRNGVCTIAMGTQGKSCPCDIGFTCINNVCRAIVGQPCMTNSDCSTNICENNICMTSSTGGSTGFNHPCLTNVRCDNSSISRCDSSSSFSSNSSRSRCNSSSTSDCRRSRSRSRNSRNSSDSNISRKSKSSESRKSIDSSDSTRSKSPRKSSDYSNSRRSKSSDSRKARSFDSLSDFYTCSDTNCSETAYSLDKKKSSSSLSLSLSNNSSPNCSPESCKKLNKKLNRNSPKCKNTSSSLNSDCTDSSSSHDKFLRRGVYVTNQQNQDQTLFTAIDQPIIDIVKTDKIYLLLANGNIVANSGINNVIYVTNKKVLRMVRFGNDIVGLDRKGKLYFAVKSGSNIWSWEHLKNFPCDVIFIDSVNTPSNNLEVLTANDKAYLYTYSANWKDGVKTTNRKSSEPRYYGKDLTRYIEVNESTNVGKTNDGQKYKHVRSAGFYNTNVLVTVLTSDTFTHVRIIDNNAYFLFEQNCF
jgi:hypothetical protein